MWRTIVNFLCGTLSQVRVACFHPCFSNFGEQPCGANSSRLGGCSTHPRQTFGSLQKTLLCLVKAKLPCNLPLTRSPAGEDRWRALHIWRGPQEIGGDDLRKRPSKAVVQSLSFWPTSPGRVILSQPWRPLDPFPPLGRTRRSPCFSWSPPLRAVEMSCVSNKRVVFVIFTCKR